MNMKKLVMMAMGIMLLAACKKDSSTDSLLMGDIQSKANGGKQVARPIKIDIFSSVDLYPDIPSEPCLGDANPLSTSGFFLNGNVTHLGKINAEKSRGQDISCEFSAGARLTLATKVKGQIVAANGDLIYYEGKDLLDLTEIFTGVSPYGTINGVWTITGGTGRFAGAAGSFPIKGIVDASKPSEGYFTATGDGTITY